MGAFVQQSLDDVDVHLVAVSANCTVAVDIPMTVDEVIHIAGHTACHSKSHPEDRVLSLLRVTQTILLLHPVR